MGHRKVFDTKYLDIMDLVLGPDYDVKLSPIEKMALWLNKKVFYGGIGSGAGYECVACGSDDMRYFKRVYMLDDAKWNEEETKDVVVPPIGGAIGLPSKVFYLWGSCRDCGEEQQIIRKPNRIKYWEPSDTGVCGF